MEALSLGSISLIYAVVAVGSMAASAALTAGARKAALRMGAVARRDKRRRHERDTPLLGGSAFYLILCALTLGYWLQPALFGLPGGETAITARTALCFLGAISLIFWTGVVDDFVELKAPPKFAAQIAAALLILASEPRLPYVFGELGGSEFPRWAVGALLATWIVGITNAMNMIDGMDGLCSGIAGLSSLTLGAIMLSAGMHANFYVLVALALAGACGGFLFHNFNPARIFLGDSGSMLLGFVLAVVSIKVDAKRSLFVSLGVPIFLLGLPLTDIALSMIRRKRRSRSLFQGDRSHLHHRLHQLGLGHRGAVLVLWAASGYLNLSAYFLAQLPVSQSSYVYLSVLATLAFWLMSLYFIEKRLSLQNARFSHLFIQQESSLFTGREQLLAYLRTHLPAGGEALPFTLIVVDSSEFLQQLAHERPMRLVEFYMNLYGILRGRLRRTDLVARVSENRMVAILSGAGGSDGSDAAVVDELSGRVRALQEEFRVFQGHAKRPEGFRVLRYPKDARQVWAALEVTADEVQVPTEPRVNPAA